MQDLHLKLTWLEPPPQDLRAQLADLHDMDEPGASVRRLAQYRLSAGQLTQLGNAVLKLKAKGISLAPLRAYKIGIVGSGTFDLIVPQLVASAARHGIDLDCVVAPFGQAMQAALDPSSSVRRASCDCVLMAMLPDEVPGLDDGLNESAGALEAIAHLRRMAESLRTHGNSIILQSMVTPPSSFFGSLDRVHAGTRRQRIDAVNDAMRSDLLAPGDNLFDVAALAERIGTDRWCSQRDWQLAKLPFAAECAPAYCEHLARLLAARMGLSRRCLVLDLDNTLWGGIIGDDGLEGICLGQGDPRGEAHLALQRYALAMQKRGVLLAVSSKNDEQIAATAVEQHPEMLLRLRNFAAFRANWTDKAANLRLIAQDVSLGLSSLVFVDDNPVERALVRQMLPEVAVPEMPEDPTFYADVLGAAGYFEAVTFSAEDANRAAYFEKNTQRRALLEASDGLDGYLASLEMVADFQPFDEVGLERIVQLINKSNQFNLTTQRYTLAEVSSLMRDQSVLTMQVRLRDCFGDNGMVSVVLLRTRAGGEMEIDTWLMSCRVLGRRLEEAVLVEILKHARARNARVLVGEYRPTPRNGLVKEHYAKLGFLLRTEQNDGTTTWELDTATQPALPPIEVRSSLPLPL